MGVFNVSTFDCLSDGCSKNIWAIHSPQWFLSLSPSLSLSLSLSIYLSLFGGRVKKCENKHSRFNYDCCSWFYCLGGMELSCIGNKCISTFMKHTIWLLWFLELKWSYYGKHNLWNTSLFKGVVPK